MSEMTQRVGARFLIGLVLASSLVGMPEWSVAQETDLARGRELFQAHCASCHGFEGEGGRGPTLATSTLMRAQTEEQLNDIIKYGVPGSAMVESTLGDEEIARVRDWVRSLGQQPVPPPAGNIARGEALYRGKGGCARCHAIKGEGGAVGPDLTTIGARRGAAHLRMSITDPEADVMKSARRGTPLPENFLLVHVESGVRRLTGVRVNEDTFSIQVRDLTGQVHSFFKSELTVLRREWGKSPMPSYQSLLSSDELDDLVGFLTSLRGDR